MKKVLFVINTLGGAGAEKALLELLKRFSPEQYQTDLYVLLEQGELIHSGYKVLILPRSSAMSDAEAEEVAPRPTGATTKRARQGYPQGYPKGLPLTRDGTATGDHF